MTDVDRNLLNRLTTEILVHDGISAVENRLVGNARATC